MMPASRRDIIQPSSHLAAISDRHGWLKKLIAPNSGRSYKSVTIARFKKSAEVKIAFVTTDNRQHFKDYGCTTPYFGTAPEALLQGFAQMGEAEIHIVSCARASMKSPEK